MKQLKHTLGLSEVCKRKYGVTSKESSFEEYEVYFENYIVATFWDGVDSRQNAKANADLYSAAPEMLEALIEINQLARCSDDRFAQYSDTIYLRTKSIIEKATGMKIEEVVDGTEKKLRD